MLHRRSASPVVLHLNRPREWIRGEFLVLPGLFSPSVVRRRCRRTAAAVAAACTAACGEGQKLGIADSPPGWCGQSTGQIKFRPETMLSMVV